MRYNPDDYPEKGGGSGGGGGGNLLPVGKWAVRVTEHENGTTNGGLEQVIVTFTAKDGRTRKAWLICEGAAGFQFGSLLKACGHEGGIDTDKTSEMRRAIYGIDVEIVVQDDTYNGVTKPKVKYINKIKGAVRSEPAPDRWQDPGRDEAPPPDDDGIPF